MTRAIKLITISIKLNSEGNGARANRAEPRIRIPHRDLIAARIRSCSLPLHDYFLTNGGFVSLLSPPRPPPRVTIRRNCSNCSLDVPSLDSARVTLPRATLENPNPPSPPPAPCPLPPAPCPRRPSRPMPLDCIPNLRSVVLFRHAFRFPTSPRSYPEGYESEDARAIWTHALYLARFIPRSNR